MNDEIPANNSPEAVDFVLNWLSQNYTSNIIDVRNMPSQLNQFYKSRMLSSLMTRVIDLDEAGFKPLNEDPNLFTVTSQLSKFLREGGYVGYLMRKEENEKKRESREKLELKAIESSIEATKLAKEANEISSKSNRIAWLALIISSIALVASIIFALFGK